MTNRLSVDLMNDVADTLASRDFDIALLNDQVAALEPSEAVVQTGVFLGNTVKVISPTWLPISARVDNWNAWLGVAAMPLYVDFLAHDSWFGASSGGTFNPSGVPNYGAPKGMLGSMATLRGWMDHINGKAATATTPEIPAHGGVLVLAVPLVTAEKPGSAGFAEVIAGGRDAEFKRLMQVLRDFNLIGKLMIRLGWEMNGAWYPWGAGSDPSGYIAAFRHVVDLMRAEGFQGKIIWNPSVQLNQIGWALCYPGDRYVDQVGLDIYDMWHGDIPPATQEQRWETALNGDYGLRAIADFARQQEKFLSIPEWGVGKDTTLHGGGIENPFWVSKMADFIFDRVNNVAWHGYWNSQSAFTGQIQPPDLRPLTAAAFKERFGA